MGGLGGKWVEEGNGVLDSLSLLQSKKRITKGGEASALNESQRQVDENLSREAT